MCQIADLELKNGATSTKVFRSKLTVFSGKFPRAATVRKAHVVPHEPRSESAIKDTAEVVGIERNMPTSLRRSCAQSAAKHYALRSIGGVGDYNHVIVGTCRGGIAARCAALHARAHNIAPKCRNARKRTGRHRHCDTRQPQRRAGSIGRSDARRRVAAAACDRSGSAASIRLGELAQHNGAAGARDAHLPRRFIRHVARIAQPLSRVHRTAGRDRELNLSICNTLHASCQLLGRGERVGVNGEVKLRQTKVTPQQRFSAASLCGARVLQAPQCIEEEGAHRVEPPGADIKVDVLK